MLKDLQRLFRASLDAFRAELGRAEPEDRVAELLTAMRRELTEARATLPLLEQAVRGARAELEKEREEVARCERRATLAERIEDGETARLAREFAARHSERASVLEQKLRAAEAERELRGREAEEMMRKYREADANRFGLVAELRRSEAGRRARGELNGEEGPFADFARMEEAVSDEAGRSDAWRDLLDEQPPPRPDPASVEDRLRELKRKMGKE